jgi:hypothetical protein
MVRADMYFNPFEFFTLLALLLYHISFPFASPIFRFLTGFSGERAGQYAQSKREKIGRFFRFDKISL